MHKEHSIDKANINLIQRKLTQTNNKYLKKKIKKNIRILSKLLKKFFRIRKILRYTLHNLTKKLLSVNDIIIDVKKENLFLNFIPLYKKIYRIILHKISL